MSIFTAGIDKNLPLVSHLMQIDTKNDAELFYLAEKVTGLTYEQALAKVENPDGNEATAWASGFEEECNIAKSIVAHLFEDRSIWPQDHLWLMESEGDRKSLPSLIVNRKKMRAGDAIPLEALSSKPPDEREGLRFELASRIVQAIGAMLGGIEPFNRCEECSSIFELSRWGHEQRFCSRRCSARAGERRRYQSRTNEEAPEGSET